MSNILATQTRARAKSSHDAADERLVQEANADSRDTIDIGDIYVCTAAARDHLPASIVDSGKIRFGGGYRIVAARLNG